jgi:hypothetical protein
MKKIIIKYKLINDQEWNVKELTPEEYYDEGETDFSIFDSVDRYFLEPRGYIDEPRERILSMIIHLEDFHGDRVESKFTYWNNGLNEISDYSQFKKNELTYRLIVTSICLNQERKRDLVLRVQEVDGHLIPLSQIIVENEEQIVDKVDLTMFKNSQKK